MEDDSFYKTACSRVTLQSDKKGYFRELVDNVSPSVNITEFSKCTTDLERVTLCAQQCWNLIGAEAIFKGKNVEESITSRLDGNKAFEKGDLKKALLFYSLSIVKCPVGIDLAHAHNNRSALFQKMDEFQLAIEDAELAICYETPENTKHKIYERMASCYASLKNFPKARVTLNLARHLSKKHCPTDTKFQKKLEKLTATITKGIESGEKPIIAHTAKETVESSNSSKESNPTFPAASPKLDVKYEPELGRYSYATQEIQTGEIVLREKAYAACLLPERFGTHCLHCFARLKAPVACETCSNVAFCSRTCRQNGESYHRYECRVGVLLLGCGISLNCYLALRIITQSSAEKLLELMDTLESKPDQVILGEDGKYDSSSYRNVYNLGALESMRNPQDFLERSIMTIFLLKCLRLVGYFQINLFKTLTVTPEELKIGSLLLRNLQVLPLNAYQICEFMMETPGNYKKSKTVDLGLGFYPTATYFNHSCAPDVTRYFIGTTMVAQTIQRIGAGKPIHDNYGPSFTKHERKERQHKLAGRYWFTCNCSACQEDWALLASHPLEIEPKNADETKILKKIHIMEGLYFDKAIEAMDAGKGLIAIELLKKYIDDALKLLESTTNPQLKPYKTVLLAQEALKLCLCGNGTIYITNPPK